MRAKTLGRFEVSLPTLGASLDSLATLGESLQSLAEARRVAGPAPPHALRLGSIP